MESFWKLLADGKVRFELVFIKCRCNWIRVLRVEIVEIENNQT